MNRGLWRRWKRRRANCPGRASSTSDGAAGQPHLASLRQRQQRRHPQGNRGRAKKKDRTRQGARSLRLSLARPASTGDHAGPQHCMRLKEALVTSREPGPGPERGPGPELASPWPEQPEQRHNRHRSSHHHHHSRRHNRRSNRGNDGSGGNDYGEHGSNANGNSYSRHHRSNRHRSCSCNHHSRRCGPKPCSRHRRGRCPQWRRTSPNQTQRYDSSSNPPVTYRYRKRELTMVPS